MEPGDVIAGRFEVEAMAGGGGMGAVFRARDRHTGEIVALKVMKATASEYLERFHREGRLLAELRHPTIVRYVAHGSTAAGTPYLALEWLDGEDLSKRGSHTGLTMEEGVALCRRVAEALAHAHAAGVIHRDIKPSNIFLVGGRPSRAVVLDFGVARLGRNEGTLTGTGMMVGTPGYMAPEQARGEKNVDSRADVYSLGCVLFQCVAGERAFPGVDAVAILARVLFEEARRLREVRPDVPAALDDLVARMLAKDPAKRPADGAAVVAELASLTALSTAKVRAPVTTQSAILTSGEKRLISVIVASSGPQSEADTTLQQHAWEAREQLSTALREAAIPFGAAVEVLANGTAIATLTSSSSATDQAGRAARLALALRKSMPDVPMVLATGRSVLSQRLPVGDAFDRAVELLRARSEDAKAPGAQGARPIWIDEATAGLLDVHFDVRGDMAGLELRGERNVVEATRTLMGRTYPCFGRERELATLMGIYEECVAEPAAQAVLVTAASGIGKSRVRYEFLQKVRQANAKACTVWLTRGDSMSAGSPFGMIAPAILRAASILDGEPLAARQKKLRARVGRHVSAKKIARVTDFLGELVGVPFPDDESEHLRAARQDAMIMGDQMLAAWIDFALAECSTQPLLIVLEDLHWGDLPSVKYTDALLRAVRDRPLMILALARPEVSDLFPQLWAGRAVTTLRLGELSVKASTRFVRETLGDAAPEEIVARIVDRAEGNAFYLEELIRSVKEGRGDAFPETVLAMVQARLERLDPQARLVLRAASVFGETFWKGGVTALLGSGGDNKLELTDWLAHLTEVEFVARRGEGKFPGEAEFIFHHAMLREAAYAMLTDADRQLGHKLAAEWLEQSGEQNAVVLAEHFERGGEPLRAIEWYHRAAEQALDGNDLAAVIAHVDRGLACGAEGAVIGSFRYLEAEARNWRGEHALAEQSARQALEHLSVESPLWYRAMSEAIVASGRLQNHERLIEVVRRLQASKRQSVQRVTTMARAVPVLLFTGHPETAAELLLHLDSAALASEPIALARTQEAYAAQAMVSGDPARYLLLIESAIASFERVGAARNLCIASVNAGYAFMGVGAYAKAKSALTEALATAERTGLLYVATAAKHNLGLVLARLGELDLAHTTELEAAQMARQQGDPRIEGGSKLYLATIAMLRGRLDDAEGHARRGTEQLATIPPAHATALAVLAEVLLARGPTHAREAAQAAKAAMEMLTSLGGLEEGEARVRLAHAEALFGIGDEEGAKLAIILARDRLLARAERLKDTELRRTFLEEVPENARTLARAHEWIV